MFGGCLNRPRNQFFVSATLALPGREDVVRIAGALIHSSVRRNDLAATARAGPSAGGAAIDIDSKLLSDIFHVDTHASGVLNEPDAYSDLRCLKATMNMVQKIDTGGTSNTSTPMLKLRMKELFAPIDARHITHWARVDSAASDRQNAAIEIKIK
jgi:hypothetical protein